MEKYKGMQIVSKAGYWNTAAAHFLNTWHKIKRKKDRWEAILFSEYMGPWFKKKKKKEQKPEDRLNILLWLHQLRVFFPECMKIK